MIIYHVSTLKIIRIALPPSQQRNNHDQSKNVLNITIIKIQRNVVVLITPISGVTSTLRAPKQDFQIGPLEFYIGYVI